MDLLLHGSLLVILAWLLVGGLGLPLPEDVALLTTGVLVERGVHPVLGIVVAFAGVLGGDAILFFLARRLGPKAYEHRAIRRALPPERRARIEAAFERHGGRLVFLARHVGGIRAGVFAMAGIGQMKPARFLAWDAAGACISVPLMIGLGFIGANHITAMRAGIAETRHYVLLAAAVIAVAILTWRHIHELRRAQAIDHRRADALV